MMNKLIGTLIGISAILATNACVVTSGSGTGGGGGTGGEGATGEGAAGATGGAGGETNGSGGTGGGGTCGDECVTNEPCMTAFCDNSECIIEPSLEGALCDDGVCAADGTCVECLEAGDCLLEGSTCEENTCVPPAELGGVCGPNLCQLLPADNDCAACMIAEGGANGECSNEGSACFNAGTNPDCTTCSEYFNGENGTFCVGQDEVAQALLNCLCTPGVCAE